MKIKAFIQEDCAACNLLKEKLGNAATYIDINLAENSQYKKCINEVPTIMIDSEKYILLNATKNKITFKKVNNDCHVS